MTFIDWSDSEGMIGLLTDFVSDAGNECQGDVRRQEFLSRLLVDLSTLASQLSISGKEAANRLRSIYNSIDQEFEHDPVTIHVRDCIDELDRVNDHGGAA
jgi:hypothetical protein